jgi:hypothetical protein
MRVLRQIPFVLLVMVAAASTASTARAQGLEWGVKGGVNFATLTSDEDPNPDFTFRIGLAAGGYVTWRIAERFEVQPEALFSQQGASVSAVGIDSTIEIDYLAMPVLARYRLSPSPRGLVLYAGPTPAVKLRARAKAEAGGEQVKTDISDSIKTFDVGVAFGAAFEFGRWSIDGRYTWGFTNISEAPEDTVSIRHRVIAGLVGVRF